MINIFLEGLYYKFGWSEVSSYKEDCQQIKPEDFALFYPTRCFVLLDSVWLPETSGVTMEVSLMGLGLLDFSQFPFQCV